MSLAAPPTLRSIAPSQLTDVAKLASAGWDALVVVATVDRLKAFAADATTLTPALAASVAEELAFALKADATLTKGPRAPAFFPSKSAPGHRLVLATLGALDDPTDDVRAIFEATSAAISRAVDGGARKPLVVAYVPSNDRFARSLDVAALGALAGQWQPLEAREAGKSGAVAIEIGFVALGEARAAELSSIELGKSLARDITGTEPERMAPRRVAALCKEAFAADEAAGRAHVAVTVDEDVTAYPLLAAVARASQQVERHKPCVVRLDYVPAGKVTRTIVLCGKGVTYDTGGADLKTDGHMAGMSRDKGGAGAVAGFVRAIAAAKLPGVRVVGLLGMVRNSIGEDAFVSDEIIVSRGGVRVKIGNTDAEGRLVLADLAALAKEIVADQPDPLILSIATLTGHAYRAYGPYGALIGNEPARVRGDYDAIDAAGEAWGEPFERSRLRREDYAFIAGKSASEDVISCNRAASVNTPRGHHFPFAFLDVVSGLRRTSTPFLHLDIAGCALEPADWQNGVPTGRPVAALMAFAATIGR